MKKEVFKTLRCKCGKMSRETEIQKEPPACPRCQQPMKYSADWYIAVTVGGKRHIQKVGRQQRQAESVLRQAHTELFQRKFFAESETLLFSEAIDQVYERKWKKNKDGAKGKRLADIVLEILGNLPLADIDRNKYYELIRTLEARKVKESTINRYRAALKTILRHHKQDYSFIEMTPENGGRIRVLSREEEARLVALFRDTDHSAPRCLPSSQKPARRSAKRDYYYEMPDFVTVLIDTGLRANELLCLPLNDINFTTKLITVWRNKAEKPRSVPMTKRVQKILECRAKNESGKLFDLDIYKADSAWQWVRKEMGLESDAHFVIHALRHTCATRLLVNGVDVYRVQKWLGHKSLKTTEKYLHLDPAQLSSAVAALEEEPAISPIQDILNQSLQVSPEKLAAIMKILQAP